MTALRKGLAAAALQCLIVLSLAGKYAWDRERLPRVWAKTIPADPNMPLRGRYLSLRVAVDYPEANSQNTIASDRFSVQNGRLTARPGNRFLISSAPQTGERFINDAIPFFIPDTLPDPSRRAAGEELWVELSVPAEGLPRPIRLGVKKNGALTPLAIG